MNIEIFDNPKPDRDYTIKHVNPEYSSVCPMTGLPDYGTITVEYIPDRHCIELKSLKYYYLSFRNEGIFYEAVINRILDELVAACKPRYMKVTGLFTPRGGLYSEVVVEHHARPTTTPAEQAVAAMEEELAVEENESHMIEQFEQMAVITENVDDPNEIEHMIDDMIAEHEPEAPARKSKASKDGKKKKGK